MGTRSTIHFQDGARNIGSVYGQMDGYISNMGARLKEITGGGMLINGIQGKRDNPEFFNGMSCLAAYTISRLKLDRYNYDAEYVDKWKPTRGSIGNIYMTDSSDRQEYNYFLYDIERTLYVRITDSDDKTIYEGPMNELDPKMESTND